MIDFSELQILWSKDVQTRYQQLESKLGNTLNVEGFIYAESVKFPIIGEMIANKRVPNQNILTDQKKDTIITVPVEEWYKSFEIDQVEAHKSGYDAIPAYSKIAMASLERRRDQVIIDAIAASTNPANAKFNYGTAKMSPSILQKINAYFTQHSVNAGQEIHLLISPSVQEALFTDSSGIIGNLLYSDKRYFQNSDLDGVRYARLNIHVIPDLPEGGLPVTPVDANTQIRTCLAYASNAAGRNWDPNIMTKIFTENPDRPEAYRFYARTTATAKILQEVGTLKISVLEEIV